MCKRGIFCKIRFMKILRRKKIRKKVPSIEINMLGESTPEDANEFYLPFIDSLEAFIKLNKIEFTFNFKLDYYNTASTRYITRILTLLKPGFNKKIIIINWFYLSIDGDMKELGQDLKDTMRMRFNLIERD